MIKHIVLFKMRSDADASAKQSLLSEVKAELEGLVGKVPTLRSMEVGINCNPSEAYDLALTATADDMDALQAYAAHPLHQAIVKKIKTMLETRACTDYTI